ncbi:bacillithiol biosynthesis cysteine-adding enzyme BshC [Alkalicoccus urumqiensis]|uniref:Putative cysteine ligase BshC n=1 Tax=Alkalicoccus urumqiensis TaxID=1548213 RepID=A0A2P6MEM3_ALKUR|nr:bacillithiol biosynthesis cysteine-adding enzyme BshC [Alkalicoccus urumqiensis]PRO64736.1 bacillithiol biosynthesis cysteine-adding enzyme BshC [Alkalicoccus urumqiensis]
MQISTRTNYPPTSFAGKYLQQEETIHAFFDYRTTDAASKAQQLENHTFPRKKMADALAAYQKKLFPCAAALHQIDRLLDETSITVVAGQQAGLWTGPMYTIHKIIHLIVEAERLEERLGRPVIPIFWVAGEDHDIDEINHVHLHDGKLPKKFQLPEKNQEKLPASERRLYMEQAEKIIREALRYLPEKKFTEDVLHLLNRDLEPGMTYTDWFVRVLYQFFKGTGLVVMDAHDPLVRELERPYFAELVERNEELQRAFLSQGEAYRDAGFGEPVALESTSAHLFIHDDKGRELLEKVNGHFRHPATGQTWTPAELKQQVLEGSVQLSNNVVTRPLMQDFILPVHTFVAGAGELAYWGLLKQVFHLFERNMPVLLPRHSITIISRKSEKSMKLYKMTPEQVQSGKVPETAAVKVNEQRNRYEDRIFAMTKEKLNQVFRVETAPLRDSREAQVLVEATQEKLTRLMTEFEEKRGRLTERRAWAHNTRLAALETELFPSEGLQERKLNIVTFLNEYGLTLPRELLEAVRQHTEDLPLHLEVYI